MIRKSIDGRRRGHLTLAATTVAIVAAALVLAACQSAGQAVDQSAGQSANQPADQPTEQPAPGGGGQRPNFQMQPAPELPTTQPLARGVVVKRDGNTLTVMEINRNFGFGQNGTPRPTPNGTPRPRPTPGGGTQIQVVVSSDAQIYQDVTFASLNGQRPSGTIQQKVQTGSLDGISDNSRVTIWGDQNGDQITAKVVVYTLPRTSQQQ